VTAVPSPLLTTADELRRLVDEIHKAGRLALDTEFVWERTYRPELGVVQVATDDTIAVIDAVAVKDLSPLFPVLQDPAIPVVLHGGGQDLEILAVLMGTPIRGVVDTQVEAAFLGYGLQMGLSVLLERAIKVRIRKDQTYTDWVRRPLKPEQVVYAEQDVAHLLPMHDQPARRPRSTRAPRLGGGGAARARGSRAMGAAARRGALHDRSSRGSGTTAASWRCSAASPRGASAPRAARTFARTSSATTSC
jgi:ribonuclease D